MMRRNLTLVLGFCLVCATGAFSQRPFSTGLKIELGTAGLLNGSDSAIPDFVQNNTDFKPGINAAIGVTSIWYFGQKKVFGVSLESVASYASFTKVDKNLLLHEFGSENISMTRYQLCNLGLPVKLNVRHRKLTVFAGVIPTWHVYGKTSQRFRWRMLNPVTDFSEGNGQSIEVWLTDRGDEQKLFDGKFFEKIFNLQAVAGAEWQLNPSLSVGLEYANFTRPNKIVRVFSGGDFIAVINNDFKYNSLTISFKWWMQRNS